MMLQAWWVLRENKPFTTEIPSEEARRNGWREATKERVLEIGWLDRKAQRQARFTWVSGNKFANR
jgi:hypothetical protein